MAQLRGDDDADIGIQWPEELTPRLSPKDAAAPTLAEAQVQGLLPTWEACRAHADELARRRPA